MGLLIKYIDYKFNIYGEQQIDYTTSLIHYSPNL